VAKSRLEGDARPTHRDPQRLVFVDVLGEPIRRFLRSLCLFTEGTEKSVLLGSAQPWAEHLALLSCMSVEGMGASLAVEGATNREVFEAYVERVLAPELRPGQVVVMDNLTAHKGERVRELIEGRGFKSFSTCHPTRQTSQSHRRGLCQDQGSAAQGGGSHPRSAGGSDRHSDLDDQRAGCTRLLRALRLPSTSSITMTTAVEQGFSEKHLFAI
jgi:hypothetical protein